MDQKFEEAVNWALDQPHLQKDLYDSYLTPDVLADARRFYGSQEFQETIRILEELGKGPWRDFALLDIGCGRGIGAYAFARCGYRVWAVDIGLGRLTGLEGARMLMGLDGAEFEVREGNVLSLDFPHDFFDVIYARQFLHHMKGNLNETLYKLPSLLKPGGILCAIRDVVIWSEEQRKRLLAEHPLNHITQEEWGFYLVQYRTAFAKSRLRILREIHPYSSIINVYPRSMENVLQGTKYAIKSRFPKIPGRIVDFLLNIQGIRKTVLQLVALRRRQHNYQLYSFFAQKGGYG
jgi:SAM-dependent methyltransferase